MKEGNSARNANAGKKTRRVSVSTKRRHACMALLQRVLPVETKEWQQPSMTTMKNLIVPSSIAIWALALQILNDNQSVKKIKSFQLFISSSFSLTNVILNLCLSSLSPVLLSSLPSRVEKPLDVTFENPSLLHDLVGISLEPENLASD